MEYGDTFKLLVSIRPFNGFFSLGPSKLFAFPIPNRAIQHTKIKSFVKSCEFVLLKASCVEVY